LRLGGVLFKRAWLPYYDFSWFTAFAAEIRKQARRAVYLFVLLIFRLCKGCNGEHRNADNHVADQNILSFSGAPVALVRVSKKPLSFSHLSNPRQALAANADCLIRISWVFRPAIHFLVVVVAFPKERPVCNARSSKSRARHADHSLSEVRKLRDLYNVRMPLPFPAMRRRSLTSPSCRQQTSCEKRRSILGMRAADLSFMSVLLYVERPHLIVPRKTKPLLRWG